jgi:hypothetical protein
MAAMKTITAMAGRPPPEPAAGVARHPRRTGLDPKKNWRNLVVIRALFFPCRLLSPPALRMAGRDRLIAALAAVSCSGDRDKPGRKPAARPVSVAQP